MSRGNRWAVGQATEVETLRAGWPAVVRSWLAALITVAIYDRSPSHAGAPFVTDDPEPTEFGRFEIDLAAQYAARSGERSGGDGQRLTVSPRWDVPDATA